MEEKVTYMRRRGQKMSIEARKELNLIGMRTLGVPGKMTPCSQIRTKLKFWQRDSIIDGCGIK